jgi:hypothetical protein
MGFIPILVLKKTKIKNIIITWKEEIKWRTTMKYLYGKM